jgi:hypothetical protein
LGLKDLVVVVVVVVVLTNLNRRMGAATFKLHFAKLKA